METTISRFLFTRLNWIGLEIVERDGHILDKVQLMYKYK